MDDVNELNMHVRDFIEVVNKLSPHLSKEFIDFRDFMNSELLKYELSQGVIDNEKSNVERPAKCQLQGAEENLQT